MTTTLDQAVKGPTFHPVSTSRKLKNGLATTLFTASFVVAMVPLIWLIYTVLARGITAVTKSTWWTHSLAGVLPEEMAGGVYHAIYGTVIQAAIAAALSDRSSERTATRAPAARQLVATESSRWQSRAHRISVRPGAA